jgi:hypothetical protein
MDQGTEGRGFGGQDPVALLHLFLQSPPEIPQGPQALEAVPRHPFPVARLTRPAARAVSGYRLGCLLSSSTAQPPPLHKEAEH